MHVVFRVDSSHQIGTGHVMRCLTLAEQLRKQGSMCRFICRDHPGNLVDQIHRRGFVVHKLPNANNFEIDVPTPAHAKWLGAAWKADADQTRELLSETFVDWLIVDHYGIDDRWEREILDWCKLLMVIDDLADRPHACDLLLDQTFGRVGRAYSQLVPENCHILCGSHYALLRPEFSALRTHSLHRRRRPVFRDLLITMGGIDKDNITGQILDSLRVCRLPIDCRITVVLGSESPWRLRVAGMAATMPWPTQVLVGVSNMAELMAQSDFAIGAAGSTSWERCCLGLPTAMVILADNQRFAASQLENVNAVILLKSNSELEQELAECIKKIKNEESYLFNLAVEGAKITDGDGCKRVVSAILDRKYNA